MSTPHLPGWYDDPSASNAERWWDGHDWTPQRRPKVSMPAPRPRSVEPSRFPLSAGMVGPAEPYPATLGVDPRVQQTLAGLIGLAGVGLIIVSFLPWGRARAVLNGIGALVSKTASFPGLGNPTVTVTYSDESYAGRMNFLDTPLHNSNPGWVALVCGILAIVAAIAYLRLRQWRVITIAVAVLGVIAGLTCVAYMVDVRGTFNDPANWADANFSPGVGLVAAFGLSLVLIALGITAFVIEWRATPKTSGY
jgi:hypothetical protein